jgi:hypothetical protein
MAIAHAGEGAARRRGYGSMDRSWQVDRRDFLKIGGAVSAGVLLGTPRLWAQEQEKPAQPARPATNVEEALAVPRTAHSLPGPFPGHVVEVHDDAVKQGETVAAPVVQAMFERGLQELTGLGLQESFQLLLEPTDIVGIKVNPVGAGLINTHHELVEAIVAWLTTAGLPRRNIVIWDRFASMLTEAGFTTGRYPGLRVEALQIIDEAAMAEGATDDSGWLDAEGNHVSRDRFDDDIYYWADCEAPQDRNYLNQHVVNGKHSYFGKLITRDLTKIINVPVFKNTGNGISMATKNLGYASINNTGRLHRPLFFNVCTEVLAFPCLRDKLVLNVTDGLRGQYDGGPGPDASFIYDYNRLFLATDPFALDRLCHELLLQKRKAMEVKVDEHPRYTEYLRYAEQLGLGVGDLARIEHVRA